MIVALSAKKRCGKDTVGDILTDKGFVKYALAEPIKRFLVNAINNDRKLPLFVKHFSFDDINGFGYDREEGLPISNDDVYRIMRSAWMNVCDDIGIKYTYEHTGVIADAVLGNRKVWSIRRLMQTLGTDIGCKIDKNIWTDYLKRFKENHDNIDLVVTDCRQPWELETLREMGAEVIHILRSDTGVIYIDNHSTERGLPIEDGDHVINNDSSLEDLKLTVKNLLKYIENQN
ncbi:deoxynucleoside monophosphate kinase [Aeromonas phage GomatiRiver_11]|nr:deoxynucleotide monophosphate kinase [Aeromonas phage AhFM11]WKW84383.1 deoxynucleoside monophosphate kinase [Aeromonas phage GomatiRiver_11]